MTLIALMVAAVLTQNGAGAPARPRADVTAVAPSGPVAPGESVLLTLCVHLPVGIHVQSDKPRDLSLIATTLALTPPPGVTIDRVEFPAPHEFVQAGQKTALLVFASDFAVQVHLTVSGQASIGELKIPAVLRYQACSDRVCFVPARATAEWAVTVHR